MNVSSLFETKNLKSYEIQDFHSAPLQGRQRKKRSNTGMAGQRPQ
jgi:hypothetical protein